MKRIVPVLIAVLLISAALACEENIAVSNDATPIPATPEPPDEVIVETDFITPPVTQLIVTSEDDLPDPDELESMTSLRLIDLTALPYTSSEEIAELSLCCPPDVEIIWNQMLTDGIFRSDSVSLTLPNATAEDVNLLSVFSDLRYVDATGSTEYLKLYAFQAAHPEIEVHYAWKLGDQTYSERDEAVSVPEGVDPETFLDELRKGLSGLPEEDIQERLSFYSEMIDDGMEEGLSEGGTAAYDPEKEKQNREYAKKIRENVNDMNDMVEGILQFSKSEGSGGKIVMQETDIRQIIGGCMIKYDGLFKQKSITLSVSGETPSQNTDPKLLTQAIDNLFSNCARYADEESEVRIVLSENDIKISNRFSGEISNVEELKKPFVKGETSRSQKGSGLGLSIVDNDLKLLGYKLELSFENGIFTATVVLR